MCCTYASETSARRSDVHAMDDEEDVSATARLCVFVNGRQVAVKDGPHGHVRAPLCTDLVLSDAVASSDAPDLGQQPTTGLRVVDMCYFQRAMTSDDVEKAAALGPLAAALYHRRCLRRYALQLLGVAHSAARGRSHVSLFTTHAWMTLLLGLVKVGDTDLQTSVLRLLRVLLQAVSLGSA
jgi:hypothetical protein